MPDEIDTPVEQSKAWWGWVAAWSLVFAMNLPFPLALGLAVTEGGGRIGMGLAAMMLWTAGLAAGSWSERLRAVMLSGGSLVALFQIIFPVLQVVAGVIGLQSWSGVAGVGGLEIRGPNAEFGGFLVTLTTGQLLVTAALVCGYCFCRVAGLPETSAERPSEGA